MNAPAHALAFLLFWCPALAQTAAPALTPLTGTVTTTEQTAPAANLAATHLKAALILPRTVLGEVTATLQLTNAGNTAATITASREGRQNCTFAPMLRVLQVGTRKVVYPAAQQSPRICTQDALHTTLSAGQHLSLTHTLTLPPGEYMVEGWFQGSVNTQRQKVDAEPVRLTVN